MERGTSHLPGAGLLRPWAWHEDVEADLGAGAKAAVREPGGPSEAWAQGCGPSWAGARGIGLQPEVALADPGRSIPFPFLSPVFSVWFSW